MERPIMLACEIGRPRLFPSSADVEGADADSVWSLPVTDVTVAVFVRTMMDPAAFVEVIVYREREM
jgi:hypothetical protein